MIGNKSGCKNTYYPTELTLIHHATSIRSVSPMDPVSGGAKRQKSSMELTVHDDQPNISPSREITHRRRSDSPMSERSLHRTGLSRFAPPPSFWERYLEDTSRNRSERRRPSHRKRKGEWWPATTLWSVGALWTSTNWFEGLLLYPALEQRGKGGKLGSVDRDTHFYRLKSAWHACRIRLNLSMGMRHYRIAVLDCR